MDDFDFGNDGGFGGDDDFNFGFDDNSSGGGFDNSFGNTTSNDDGFSGGMGNASIPDDAFGNSAQGGGYNNADFSDSDADAGAVKKKSVIIIIIGVVALLLVLIIAGAAMKNKNKPAAQTQVPQQSTQQQVTDASSLMNNAPSQSAQQQTVQQPVQQQTVIVTVEPQFNWTEITGSENITYNNNSYSELMFSVTGVKHYARAVDANNSRLVTKTTVSGSISGLSGTYTIDVPYSKGVTIESLMNKGPVEFSVYVKFGEYNGRQVIDDILTYNPN